MLGVLAGVGSLRICEEEDDDDMLRPVGVAVAVGIEVCVCVKGLA